MSRSRTPEAERFWRRVVKTDTCWNWVGYIDPDGYGRFPKAGRRNGNHIAHRFSYELLVGPIPKGLVIDHLCRNRICQNPAHMEPVSVRTNTLRGNTNQARNLAKTHCKFGHPFDEANTLLLKRVRKSGEFIERRCRTCGREQTARFRTKELHLKRLHSGDPELP